MHTHSKRRNKRLFGWTIQEIEYLDEGVKKFGENWNEILENYSFHPSRNPNSLRKKYKRLEKERCKKGRGRGNEIHIRAWSEDEIEYLEIGVERYGTNWKKILDSFPFNNRTVNALSKKWRYEFRRGREGSNNSVNVRRARNDYSYNGSSRSRRGGRRRIRRKKKLSSGGRSRRARTRSRTMNFYEDSDEDNHDDEDNIQVHDDDESGYSDGGDSSLSGDRNMDIKLEDEDEENNGDDNFSMDHENMLDEAENENLVINICIDKSNFDNLIPLMSHNINNNNNNNNNGTMYTLPNGCISPFRPQKRRAYSPKLHHYNTGFGDYDFMNL